MHEPSEIVTARNNAVLNAALQLAGEKGFRNFTRADVASRAEVSDGTVNWAYGTMDRLRDAVMAEAVKVAKADVVAQGLAEKHPAAVGAPAELKASALASLAA